MDRKFLTGLFFGLVIATTSIYAWEAKSHIIDDPNIEGPFFLIVTILHVPVAYWVVKNTNDNSNLAWAIMLVGTIVIMVIFAISRSDAAFLVGRDKPGGFGSLSVISKVLQAGIIAISAWAMMDNNNNRKGDGHAAIATTFHPSHVQDGKPGHANRESASSDDSGKS